MNNKTQYNRKYNSSLLNTSRALRKNLTKEEKHLWYDYLNDYPNRILRQKVFGRYIVDFYCADAKLVIELDGSQHYTEEGKEYDKERTDYLKSFGIEVLRIKNGNINENFTEVCNSVNYMIQNRIKELTEEEEI